jgi:hypothetical protein
MVCEKNADVAHDFMVDPIRLVRGGGGGRGGESGPGVWPAAQTCKAEGDPIACLCRRLSFIVQQAEGAAPCTVLHRKLLRAGCCRCYSCDSWAGRCAAAALGAVTRHAAATCAGARGRLDHSRWHHVGQRQWWVGGWVMGGCGVVAHRPDGSLLACLCNRLGLLLVLPGRAGLRAEAAATVLPFRAHRSPLLPIQPPFVGYYYYYYYYYTLYRRYRCVCCTGASGAALLSSAAPPRVSVHG